MLRDADQLLAPAIAGTIAALGLKPEDAAAATLAERYAAAIDADTDGEGYALDRLGPKLHAVLESLGATPAGRARLKGGKAADAAPNRLQQLRNTRGA